MLAESNGSLPSGLTHVTCRLTAKNRDQLRNRTLGNREYRLPLPVHFRSSRPPSRLPRLGYEASAGRIKGANRHAVGDDITLTDEESRDVKPLRAVAGGATGSDVRSRGR